MIPSSKWDVKGGIDMDHIVIGGIAMPRTKTLEVGGYYESKEAVMASGKTVRDVLGLAGGTTASWEWVPAGLLTQLVPLVGAVPSCRSSIPTPPGPRQRAPLPWRSAAKKIFKFVDGVPMWYNVELTATAQEVV